MKEQVFKDTFVSQFLANWTMEQYNHCCATGDHSPLENPPVEDAFYLADLAWKKIIDEGKGVDEIARLKEDVKKLKGNLKCCHEEMERLRSFQVR